MALYRSRVDATPVVYELHQDPRSSHQRIARFLRREGRGPILDVGLRVRSARRLLADTELPIDGIEPSAPAAESARPFYRSIQVGRIEDVELPASTYPVIVCADVLEHTPDPQAVLESLIAASTADAAFVISLPNVAHLAARLLLLTGASRVTSAASSIGPISTSTPDRPRSSWFAPLG